MHVDWGVLWSAVAAVAAVAALFLGLVAAWKASFGLRVKAIMDTPRRAIKVILTARGEGEVVAVSVVIGRHDELYPTSMDLLDGADGLPHRLRPGGKLTIVLKPQGPSANFVTGASHTKLKVFVDSGRRKPRRFRIRTAHNEHWASLGEFHAATPANAGGTGRTASEPAQAPVEGPALAGPVPSSEQGEQPPPAADEGPGSDSR